MERLNTADIWYSYTYCHTQITRLISLEIHSVTLFIFSRIKITMSLILDAIKLNFSAYTVCVNYKHVSLAKLLQDKYQWNLAALEDLKGEISLFSLLVRRVLLGPVLGHCHVPAASVSLLNFQSWRHIGQSWFTCWEFSHLTIQWMWKQWEHSPHTEK